MKTHTHLIKNDSDVHSGLFFYALALVNVTDRDAKVNDLMHFDHCRILTEFV